MAKGQLVLGGVNDFRGSSFWVSLYPFLAGKSFVINAGMVAGAMWAGIPAVLKVALNVGETLVSLMA